MKYKKETEEINVNTVFTMTSTVTNYDNDGTSHDDMNYGEDSAVQVKCKFIIPWKTGADVLQGFRKHLRLELEPFTNAL